MHVDQIRYIHQLSSEVILHSRINLLTAGKDDLETCPFRSFIHWRTHSTRNQHLAVLDRVDHF